MTATLDAESQAAMNNFSRPGGMVGVTMAGESTTHNMQLAEVASHVSWNMPGPAVSMGALNTSQFLTTNQVIDMDPGIDLGRIGGVDASPGPQLGGTNYAAIKPKTFGF